MARKESRASAASLIRTERIERSILLIRGEKVMLDVDLAELYRVEIRTLLQAVKRNSERFPPDFAFQLTSQEFQNLRSQIVISSSHGGRRYQPYAFTEHGALMAANVLNSPRAVQMSVFVIQAFIKMRSLLVDHRQLSGRLAELEKKLTKKLTQRLNVHEAAIVDVLQRIMRLLDPPPDPEPTRPRIGFNADK